MASLSTLEFKSQSEQRIVTTKPTSPIKGEASLELIPFLLLMLIIVEPILTTIEHLVTPTLMVSNRMEPLELLYATTINTTVYRCGLKYYFNF